MSRRRAAGAGRGHERMRGEAGGRGADRRAADGAGAPAGALQCGQQSVQPGHPSGDRPAGSAVDPGWPDDRPAGGGLRRRAAATLDGPCRSSKDCPSATWSTSFHATGCRSGAGASSSGTAPASRRPGGARPSATRCRALRKHGSRVAPRDVRAAPAGRRRRAAGAGFRPGATVRMLHNGIAFALVPRQLEAPPALGGLPALTGAAAGPAGSGAGCTSPDDESALHRDRDRHRRRPQRPHPHGRRQASTSRSRCPRRWAGRAATGRTPSSSSRSATPACFANAMRSVARRDGRDESVVEARP